MFYLLIFSLEVRLNSEQSIQKLYHLGKNIGHITVLAEIERFVQLLRIRVKMLR